MAHTHPSSVIDTIFRNVVQTDRKFIACVFIVAHSDMYKIYAQELMCNALYTHVLAYR